MSSPAQPGVSNRHGIMTRLGIALGSPGRHLSPTGAAVQVQAHRCVVHADARGMPVRTRGGEYLITYLDQDMLIGRTVAVPGSFVFEKVAEDVDN